MLFSLILYTYFLYLYRLKHNKFSKKKKKKKKPRWLQVIEINRNNREDKKNHQIIKTKQYILLNHSCTLKKRFIHTYNKHYNTCDRLIYQEGCYMYLLGLAYAIIIYSNMYNLIENVIKHSQQLLQYLWQADIPRGVLHAPPGKESNMAHSCIVSSHTSAAKLITLLFQLNVMVCWG